MTELRALVLLCALAFSAVADAKPRRAVDPETAYASSIAGKTYRSYSPQHGTQVEYLSPAGKAYLWYPGNRVVLAGDWRVEPDPHAPRFLEIPPGSGHVEEAPPRFQRCYRYGANTYNPVTGSSGATWECQGVFSAGLGEPMAGDVFGLATRSAPPFVMDKRAYRYGDLKAASAR